MIFTSQSIKYPPNLHFFMFLQIAISCFQKHFTSRNFISLLFHFSQNFNKFHSSCCGGNYEIPYIFSRFSSIFPKSYSSPDSFISLLQHYFKILHFNTQHNYLEYEDVHFQQKYFTIFTSLSATFHTDFKRFSHSHNFFHRFHQIS